MLPGALDAPPHIPTSPMLGSKYTKSVALPPKRTYNLPTLVLITPVAHIVEPYSDPFDKGTKVSQESVTGVYLNVCLEPSPRKAKTASPSQAIAQPAAAGAGKGASIVHCLVAGSNLPNCLPSPEANKQYI